MRTLFFSVLGILLFVTPALADHHSESSRHGDHGDYEHEHSWDGAGRTAMGVADTSNILPGESASVLFANQNDWIQTYLGIYQTKGGFTFGVGGAYKFTVVGSRSTGLHIGPGFVIGTVADNFAFAIFAAIGGHFTIGDHLLFSVDGGPIVTHVASGKPDNATATLTPTTNGTTITTTETSSSTTNFSLRGLGSVLGLTVAYLF